VTNSSHVAVAKDEKSRWLYLIAAMVAMMGTANTQFGWTLFVTPLTKALHASNASVQVAFTLFVLVQTWLLPIYSYFVDKFGARTVVGVAGLFVGGGWVASGMVSSLTGLYVAYSFTGIGAGLVYSACVGLGIKWFPDRRGLAVGLITGAFGMGSVLTTIPISKQIAGGGYSSAFITWGIVQGLVCLLASLFLKMPEPGWKPAGFEQKKPKAVLQSAHDYTPKEMLGQRSFYVLYTMMTLVAFGGLTVTAQLAPMGNSQGFNKVIIFGGLSAVTLALMMGNLIHGVTRPFWGYVSDRIGRYNTMVVAFTIQSFAVMLLAMSLKNPYFFVIAAGFSYFSWGEIYSLFPTAIGDLFGSKYATTNYGIQYTAKGVASILAGPGAAILVALAANSWLPVLWASVAANALAAALGFFYLRPLVKKLIARSRVDGAAAMPKGHGEVAVSPAR
jgi:MFS transporter, OFA family, oxalate/formate antiporter